VLASVRPLAALERSLANELLGADIAGAPRARTATGWIARLAAYWTDGRTWRGMLYLLLRFPAGMAAFIVAVTAYGIGLTLLAAPVLSPLVADGLDVGPWDTDTVVEGLALMPLGALTLIAAGWISVAMGALSVELARWGTRSAAARGIGRSGHRLAAPRGRSTCSTNARISGPAGSIR
jgi:Putative sensor